MDTNTEINYTEVLEKAEAFVKEYFEKHMPKDLVFHSFEHTKDVVEAAEQIAVLYNLDEATITRLKLSAWFHDIGYTEGPKGHENRSVEMLKAFASELGIKEQDIQSMECCIGATKLDKKPATLTEMILKDADFSHLGSKEFFTKNNLLRTEWMLVQGKRYTDEEWTDNNIAFLSKHEYETPIAKALYAERKAKNLEKLKAQPSSMVNMDYPEKSRGVETMFKVTLRNQNQLSQIADNKANIMLSITAIMLSVILSSLGPKLDSNRELLVPTIILVGVCLITMLLAILAIRPIIAKSEYTKEKFLDKKINLLFFGNFYKLDLDTYEWSMAQMMKDDDLLYKSLTKDLYYLGIVLARKYKYLQICYAVFVIGVAIASIAFMAAIYYQQPDL